MQKKCVISLFSSGHTFLGILAPLVPPIERLERGFRSWKRKSFRCFRTSGWEQKHSWAINDWFKSEQYWIRKIMMSQPRHIIRLVRHIKWSLFGEVTLLRKSVIRRCILVGGGGGRGQVGLCKTFATTTKIACKCVIFPTHDIILNILEITIINGSCLRNILWVWKWKRIRFMNFSQNLCWGSDKSITQLSIWYCIFHKEWIQHTCTWYNDFVIRMDALWPSPYIWMKPLFSFNVYMLWNFFFSSS